MRQILVVDMNVIAHNILGVLDKLGGQRYDLNKVVEAQMMWVASGKWLQPDRSQANERLGFVPFDSQPSVVWCMDTKPYWRTQYLLRDDVWSKIIPLKRKKSQPAAPIVYKGGRGKPPTNIVLVRSAMRMIIAKYGWWLFEGQADSNNGYEADDMAALLVRLNDLSSDPAQLYLMTCDHDWIGLISEYTSWLNTYGAFPRYRRLSNWSVGYKVTMQKPSDLWVHKAGTGDKSDNLPNVGGDPDGVAALLPVISLKEPPTDYDPMLDVGLVRKAGTMLKSTIKPRINVEALERLGSSGMQLCMNPLHHTSN